MKGCKISNDKKKTLHVSQRIPVYMQYIIITDFGLSGF